MKVAHIGEQFPLEDFTKGDYFFIYLRGEPSRSKNFSGNCCAAWDWKDALYYQDLYNPSQKVNANR